MNALTIPSASIAQPTPQELALSGEWTARGLESMQAQFREIDALPSSPGAELHVDGTNVKALDSAGAWVLQGFLRGVRNKGTVVQLSGLRTEFATLLEAQQQIRKARQNQIKAQAEAQIRLAEIEKLLGEDL